MIEDNLLRTVVEDNIPSSKFVELYKSENENFNSETCFACREQFFKLIAEFSEDWIYWINSDSTISYMSPSSKHITGYDIEEIVRYPEFVNEIIYEKDREKYTKHTNAFLLRKNLCNEEFRIIKKSGEIRWISHMCQAVYDQEDKYLGRYVRNKDITEMKNSNIYVLQKEKLVNNICDWASVGYYQIYFDGRLKSANKIFLDMLGYDLSELLNEKDFEKTCILDSDKREEFKTTLKKFGFIKNFESAWIKKGCSIIYLKETATLGRDTLGGISFYEVFVQDITERKNAENIAVVASSKKQKYEELITEFLATVSHEINTPLNVILNMVSMLKNDCEVGDKHEINSDINIIKTEGERIKRTIDLILEISQLQSGTYEVGISEIDLIDDIFSNIFRAYNEKAKEKNVALVITNKLFDPKIVADKHGVYQIFLQLIDNALKYTHSGKIEILLYLNGNNQVTVEVTDTGMGIKEEYVPFLFKVFSQEDNSYSKLFEGTGLGLAIVKKHCELNDALIEVESKKNIGTKVKIIFVR